MDIRKELEAMADAKLQKFSSALIPGADIIGVRIPQLRLLAKRIAKEEDWREFLTRDNRASFEERLLHGLVIGYAKMTVEERLERIGAFVHLIDSWAVCDCACSTFKAVRKELTRTLGFLQPYLNSDKEFELRFGVVMLMDYFINDEYIDYTLLRLAGLAPQHYYSKMAVALALSVCYVKYPEKTMRVLKGCALDKDTFHKTLQKIIESKRVAEHEKNIIRELKR
ncbi:MAG: DNA alkylation repair protein [Bacteroides sp.]|nr:DNA alkylation repair protein [Roseburia sp.]MCM1346102.1 DNA alkylation repair protein [Bacteroides sp.]MCM1420737.1 DNA alkylation repair protein [Bacteroides sp.]